jgi:hypothetical protein
MRTPEQKLATKLRKEAEHEAHRDRVFKHHPNSVLYAKSKFKKGKKHVPKHRAPIKLGVQ